jgi:hypothetical protein
VNSQVHGLVRVYFSPAMVEYRNANPDISEPPAAPGNMAVKEMYDDRCWKCVYGIARVVGFCSSSSSSSRYNSVCPPVAAPSRRYVGNRPRRLVCPRSPPTMSASRAAAKALPQSRPIMGNVPLTSIARSIMPAGLVAAACTIRFVPQVAGKSAVESPLHGPAEGTARGC